MKKYLMGVDNGGTYIKTAIYGLDGKLVGLAKEPNDSLVPGAGMSEYDQEQLFKTNCTCIRSVIEKTQIDPEEIACLGISGQGCGFYAVDQEGRNIRNAISSSDRRAASISEKWLNDGTSARTFGDIFRNPTPGHLNTILAWLKEKESESYRRIAHLFAMKDLLIYRLTGSLISGYGCQSASCLMNMHTDRFDPKLADAFGIPEMVDKFAKLVWDVDICGYVTAEAAALCGLKMGTPVCGGCHDVVAAIIAMGIFDAKPCFIITGTHAINGYISDSPVLNDSVTSTELFAFPGKYLIEESNPASSAVLEWVIDQLFDRGKMTSGELYEEINRLVDGVSPDESDLVFLPYLSGYRDNVHARGGWVGLLPGHTKAHMLRAVYEGVAYTHMRHLENIFRNRPRPDFIHMAGGATNSDLWVQLFADVIGIPLEVVPKEELGTKGTAIVAAVAAECYPDIHMAMEKMSSPRKTVMPRPDMLKLYREKYLRFMTVAEKSDDIWPSFK